VVFGSARPASALVFSSVCLAGLLVTARAQPVTPNVLLVTIDTLRADRLGAYGYAAARTPVLDRLAAEGVRFADATAHAPLTYPSHAAILTGRYPANFGIRLNGMDPLPAVATTIAERLKPAGYRTGAVVGSVVLERSVGLDQGFDQYDDRIDVRPTESVAVADLQRPASDVTNAAVAGLKSLTGGSRAPWFLWVHYYDPHLPYSPPATHAAAAAGRPYDGEVAFVDAEIGRLLASVDRSRTVVVVTADHGESLGDHGESDHGYFLYDSTLHVPLVVSGPLGQGRIAPRVVAEQVRSIDIAPTIAALAGLGPEPSADGESLVPLLEGRTRQDVPVSLAESWYPRLHFGWSELRSARVGEWKYIAAPKPELYDLRSDRVERKNLVHDRATVAGRLAAEVGRLATLGAKVPATPAAQPDPATVERLQALGYVGSFAPVTAGSGAENPLDRLADYRAYRDLFSRALTLLGQKRPGEAAAILQRLVKQNVRAFEAHLYLGNAYAAQSKTDAALGEYEVAAMLNPSLALPYFEAAKVLSARGEHRAAAERCRAGLEREPRSFYGYYTLGVVHQKAGQWTEAQAVFAKAVAINPRDPRGQANLAGAALRTGDLDLAAVHFERMIDLKYQVPGAQYNLGVIAAKRQNLTEAERRYKLALQADPSFAPAIQALTKLKQ
jgi:arylsulfatase A-like enzyme/tetratricopeptide (TPR) repeat protein